MDLIKVEQTQLCCIKSRQMDSVLLLPAEILDYSNHF